MNPGAAQLGPELIGTRVMVRSRLPGETSASGRPAMTDVLGRVVGYTDGVAMIEKRDGALVPVPAETVVTAKVVPDGLDRRRTRPAGQFTADALMRICTRGWPPADSEALGDWLLRDCGGFTRRANSAATHGDPQANLDATLSDVIAYYTARHLRPRAQVVAGSRWEAALSSAGWRPEDEEPTQVQVADLGETRRLIQHANPDWGSDVPSDVPSDVRIEERASEEWIGAYSRAREYDIEQVRAVLEGPPRVGFARIGHRPDAICRVTVTGEWAGLHCLQVDRSQRRRGLGHRIVSGCLHWAIEHGADKAYVQLEALSPASRLFAGYGFATHHDYRYFSPVGAA